MQQESIELDIAALRALLENLISLSFDQEQLMADFSKLTPKDGKYVKLGQKQRKLKDDMRMIEDSINALAKRIPDPMFQSHVSHELELINLLDFLNYVFKVFTFHSGKYPFRLNHVHQEVKTN